jgi:hypothetical protein
MNDDEDKEWPALKAALHVAELEREFPSVIAVRLHLKVRISESEATAATTAALSRGAA